jgi:hypothetical protein
VPGLDPLDLHTRDGTSQRNQGVSVTSNEIFF